MAHDENPPSQTREAVFTLKRAAEVAGVSPSTLRRNKAKLIEHGAIISESGWKVPMSALIASGLMRQQTPPDTPVPTPRTIEAAIDEQVHDRVRELERELLEERHRRELAEERQRTAEAVARERGEALETERMALRMLTAGATAPMSAPEPEAPEPQTPNSPRTSSHPAPERRSWWRRTFG